MPKTIRFKSEEYPYKVNFSVYADWEDSTGLDIEEIGKGKKMRLIVNFLKLAYYSIKYACKKEGMEFNISEDEFIESLTPEESGIIVSKIVEELPKPEPENKRQPKKQAAELV